MSSNLYVSVNCGFSHLTIDRRRSKKYQSVSPIVGFCWKLTFLMVHKKEKLMCSIVPYFVTCSLFLSRNDPLFPINSQEKVVMGPNPFSFITTSICKSSHLGKELDGISKKKRWLPTDYIEHDSLKYNFKLRIFMKTTSIEYMHVSFFKKFVGYVLFVRPLFFVQRNVFSRWT